MNLASFEPGEEEYRRALASYADCLVALKVPELARFMNMSITDFRTDGALKALAKAAPACARPKRKRGFGPEALALRGAVIEKAYSLEFGPPSAPATFADVPRHVYLPARRGGDEMGVTMAAGMYALFDCVVRARPADAAEMLRRPTESEGERQAFAKLEPAFAPCLPPGMQLKMRASNVRPYIAEAFYTLTKLKHAATAVAPLE